MVGGGVCKVIFVSNPTVVLRLGWGWGFDNKKHMENYANAIKNAVGSVGPNNS